MTKLTILQKHYWERVTSALSIKMRLFIQINFTQFLTNLLFTSPVAHNFSGIIWSVSKYMHTVTLFTALLYKICVYHYILSTTLFWLPIPPHNIQLQIKNKNQRKSFSKIDKDVNYRFSILRFKIHRHAFS